ncbi:DNA-deoxyinosine glycosylase [Adlercreutzia caecimuris]|uniref:NAD(P)H-hydrate epimerase n=1 Tax=Adlercreutzia caecimuris TaxID=671266 RepID=A0A4S4G7Z2_9ACTN|nr:DNA-deoxyinosine glycosylase [Adlercreutzia caecimuris]THG38945.1 DNA-deoxyinosine glycosylase [Adlercreutzia caecimuris]
MTKETQRQPQSVEHGIPPVFDGRSEVLVLGTMPSPKSREAGFFYGHPQNRFWRVLAALFDEPVPESNAERADLLLRHHIALWDVLASCDIEGASDASIRNARPNDLSRILHAAPVRHVFCTGATSARLYGKLCEPICGIAAQKLPSTSPANAAWSLPRLVEACRPVAEAVTCFEPPVLDVSAVVALERAIAAAGTPLDRLMRRAGRFLAYEARKMLKGRTAGGNIAAESGAAGADVPLVAVGAAADFDASSAADGARHRGCRREGPVVVFCGSGNNGGDGWVAAEYLDRWGIPVRVVTARAPEDLTALSDRAAVLVAPNDGEVADLLAASPLAIDAILGTGFSHDAVKAPFYRWIRALNAARVRGTVVVAADVPSGLSAQTGAAAADTVRADVTVTMIAPKPGLYIVRDQGCAGRGGAEGEPLAVQVPGGQAGAATAPLVPAPCCGRIRVAPLAYIEPLLEAAAG